ncbi:MAG: hypothetical protein ABI721_03700 [Candidatus Dojkabacteria bacterium]
MALTEEQILKKTRELLLEEGIDLDRTDKTASEMLEEFILPGLKGSKDTLESIYYMQAKDRGGFLGKIKSIVQRKLINTTINVIEKQSMRQQKFNELTYKAIELLIEENKNLQKTSSIKK